jgi:hypothetical protein
MSKQPNRPGSQKRRPQQRKGRTAMAAKGGRANRTTWILVGGVLVVGIALIAAFASSDKEASSVGPQPGRDHWHAALGVYDCDHWLGDATGTGVWQWPAATGQGSPARVGTNIYAGLHSHGDGIIHMEPVAPDESGDRATVGRYFEFGGWDLGTSGYSFLDTTVKNGDECGGKPSVLRWATAKFNGDPNADQKYTEQRGNPADFKLNDGDVVVIAFMPASESFAKLGNPPSLVNLPGAEGREGQGGTMPTIPPTNPATTAGTTPATSKP